VSCLFFELQTDSRGDPFSNHVYRVQVRRLPLTKPLIQISRSLRDLYSLLLFLVLPREKIKIQGTVVDQLIQGANSDIRQVLNMLMTWKLSKSNMSFEEGKDLFVFCSSLPLRPVASRVSSKADSAFPSSYTFPLGS
jgi:hypothetical protein